MSSISPTFLEDRSPVDLDDCLVGVFISLAVAHLVALTSWPCLVLVSRVFQEGPLRLWLKASPLKMLVSYERAVLKFVTSHAE